MFTWGPQQVGVAVPVDPFFANVVLLLHGDGTNGSTSFIDSSSSARGVTVSGASLSTSAPKFGTASMNFAAGGVASVADSADFDFGSGDFTIEFWVILNFNNSSTIYVLAGKRLGASFGPFALTVESGTFKARFKTSTSLVWDETLEAPGIAAAGQWYHFAVSRSGTSFRLFIDGVLVSSATRAGALRTNANPVYIGARSDSTGALNGRIDDLRITKGVARYTANFTPPTAPFPDS